MSFEPSRHTDVRAIIGWTLRWLAGRAEVRRQLVERYKAAGLTLVQVARTPDGQAQVADPTTQAILMTGTWDEVQATWRDDWVATEHLDLAVADLTDVAPSCLDVDTDLPEGLIAAITAWTERNPSEARDWLNDPRHR